MFESIKNSELCCKLKNCEFGKDFIKYWGHKIGHRTAYMDLSKTVPISIWRAPTFFKEL